MNQNRCIPSVGWRSSAVAILASLVWWWVSMLATGVAARADEPDQILDRWLATQKDLTSWSSDFVQIRYLKALTQPLRASGHLWFEAPNRFRWELGNPVQSVALRKDENLWSLSPQLKRAERYSLNELQKGPIRDALALLDTGFPRDAAEFRRGFTLVRLSTAAGVHVFHLQPKASAVKRLLPDLTVEVSAESFSLTATELIFADGSRLRNEFTQSVKNPKLPADWFNPGTNSTWKISEPMKSK